MPVRKIYRSEDGRHFFAFVFVQRSGHLDIYCTRRPSTNGRDGSTVKTHIYPSGLICFVSGREPTSQREAESRASEWAEYFLLSSLSAR